MPLTPLFDPEAFFRKRPDPSLLLPTAIVLTYGMLPVTVIIVSTIWPDVADTIQSSQFTMTFLDWRSMWWAIGLTVVVQTGAWCLEAIVMYVLSVGGTGDYSRLLAYMGWGYLPLVVLSVVEVVVLAVLDAIGILDHSSLAFIAFPAVSLLWTVYIWMYAVRVGRNVTLWRGLVAAIITATLYYWGWYLFG